MGKRNKNDDEVMYAEPSDYFPKEIRKKYGLGEFNVPDITKEIRERLFELQDEDYAVFMKKLLPTVDPKSVIGVRTPELKKYAKEISGRNDINGFLYNLPHLYFEENQLHAFLISGINKYDTCVERTETFLPFIDNWATCDQLNPASFKRNKKDLLRHIRNWIKSKKTYTVRFAVKMLMNHFLDEDFKPEYLKMVADINSDEYYINMGRAWYFSFALIKQYGEALPYILENRLDKFTHNWTIQKCIESYRITPEQKEYFKTLRR